MSLAWWALNDTHDRERKATAPDSHSERIEQIETDRAGLPIFAESFASNPEPQDTDEREDRDLAAQEASAVWGFWVALFAGAQLIATVIGLIYIKGTLQATKDAVDKAGEGVDAAHSGADKMVELGKAQVRAYMSLDCKANGEFDDAGLGMVVSCKNSGQSPARRIHIQTSIATVNGLSVFDLGWWAVGDLASQASNIQTTGIGWTEVSGTFIKAHGFGRLIVKAIYVDVFDDPQADEFHFLVQIPKVGPPSISAMPGSLAPGQLY